MFERCFCSIPFIVQRLNTRVATAFDWSEFPPFCVIRQNLYLIEVRNGKVILCLEYKQDFIGHKFLNVLVCRPSSESYGPACSKNQADFFFNVNIMFFLTRCWVIFAALICSFCSYENPWFFSTYPCKAKLYITN